MTKSSSVLVQDLHPIKKIVISCFPVVPNSATTLASMSPNSKLLTVVDVINAFYSIRMYEDSMFLLTFTYQGLIGQWGSLRVLPYSVKF